jgi:site-specific recombinase XerC
MPPELPDVLEACLAARTWRTRGRAAEPDLAGARDKALLLVGFAAALRSSELVALDFEHVNEHPQKAMVPLAGRAVAPSPTGESFGF